MINYKDQYLQVIKRNMSAVWVASTSWAIHNRLTSLHNIHTIGTIIGFTDETQTLDLLTPYTMELFTKLSKERMGTSPVQSKSGNPDNPCPQCWTLSPANISLVTDPAVQRSAFSVYAAIYSVGHALHNMLECTSKACKWSPETKVLPWKVNIFFSLMRVTPDKLLLFPDAVWNNYSPSFFFFFFFKLLKVLQNTSIDVNGTHLVFDENGNPNVGYSVVEWVWTDSDLEFIVVGHYYKELTINKSLFKWHTANSEVKSDTYLKCMNSHNIPFLYTKPFTDPTVHVFSSLWDRSGAEGQRLPLLLFWLHWLSARHLSGKSRCYDWPPFIVWSK